MDVQANLGLNWSQILDGCPFYTLPHDSGGVLWYHFDHVGRLYVSVRQLVCHTSNHNFISVQ